MANGAFGTTLGLIGRWGAALVLAGLATAGGETFKLPVIGKEVAARPASAAIEGPLPRPVLMVKLEERGATIEDPTVSSRSAITRCGSCLTESHGIR